MPQAPGTNLFTRADYVGEFGERELVERCDRDNDGVEDVGVFESVRATAESEVWGYVDARPTGIAEPSVGLLRRVALDIMRYRLYVTRPDQWVIDAYDKAVTVLRQIASGRIGNSAGGAGGGPATTAAIYGEGDFLVDAPERVFTRDTLRDFY